MIPQRVSNAFILIEIGGTYELCMFVTEGVFKKEGAKQVKASLKFSNEYYKDLEKTSKKQSSAKKIVPEDAKDIVTEGHFAPLIKRIKKISKITDDINAHQEWEREKERQYNQ